MTVPVNLMAEAYILIVRLQDSLVIYLSSDIPLTWECVITTCPYFRYLVCCMSLTCCMFCCNISFWEDVIAKECMG